MTLQRGKFKIMTQNKNQEYVSKHQERTSENDEENRRNHKFKIISKKREMTCKK